MQEFQFTFFLRNLFLIVGIIGALVGLDFIFGAKVLIALKRIPDKVIDIDKILSNVKIVRTLGVIILIVSLIILFLISGIQL